MQSAVWTRHFLGHPDIVLDDASDLLEFGAHILADTLERESVVEILLHIHWVDQVGLDQRLTRSLAVLLVRISVSFRRTGLIHICGPLWLLDPVLLELIVDFLGEIVLGA